MRTENEIRFEIRVCERAIVTCKENNRKENADYFEARLFTLQWILEERELP